MSHELRCNSTAPLCKSDSTSVAGPAGGRAGAAHQPSAGHGASAAVHSGQRPSRTAIPASHRQPVCMLLTAHAPCPTLVVPWLHIMRSQAMLQDGPAPAIVSPFFCMQTCVVRQVHAFAPVQGYVAGCVTHAEQHDKGSSMAANGMLLRAAPWSLYLGQYGASACALCQ